MPKRMVFQVIFAIILSLTLACSATSGLQLQPTARPAQMTSSPQPTFAFPSNTPTLELASPTPPPTTRGTSTPAPTATFTPIPTITPSPTSVPPTGPRYDGLASCKNEPPMALKLFLQTQYAGIVTPDSKVEIALRNKYGTANENYELIVRVIAPDNSTSTAKTVLSADHWSVLTYPTNFAGARAVFSGIYTTIWETTTGKFVACSGFVVK